MKLSVEIIFISALKKILYVIENELSKVFYTVEFE